MLSFCGTDRCQLDSNGRLKFSPRILEDFARSGSEVVLHCLPEGAVAVYPEKVYESMRRPETDAAGHAGRSMVFRRELRRFGAWSTPQRISTQGRITIPPEYRDFAGLSGSVIVVGVEIGVEIWDRGRWLEEQKNFMEHAREKGEREMADDLENPFGRTGEGKNV
ncbi:MAG: hypothetical protein J5858_13695 [Lentisphaeria bacterium]|nr:hypothetical protein [Lentisphaeria bacterium]